MTMDWGHIGDGRELLAIACEEARLVARRVPAQDMDDVIQEAALRMLEKRTLLDMDRPPTQRDAYMGKVGRSGAINYLMWRARRFAEVPVEHVPESMESRDSPEAEYEAEVCRRQLAAVLVVAEVYLSPRELELLKDRLGVEPMSDSLRMAHPGTRGILAFRGRAKLMRIAEWLGCLAVDETRLRGLFVS